MGFVHTAEVVQPPFYPINDHLSMIFHVFDRLKGKHTQEILYTVKKGGQSLFSDPAKCRIKLMGYSFPVYTILHPQVNITIIKCLYI